MILPFLIASFGAEPPFTPGSGIHVVVNDIDETDRLHMDSQFSWNDLRSSRASATLPFIIAPSGSYSPVIGWGVQIFETDGSRVWIGTIQKWGVRWIGNDGWRVITLTCVGLMKTLDGTQLESKKFTNATAATIIADQFTLVPTSPLTLGTISTGATVADIDVAGSFKDLLDKLALLSGYVYFIRPSDATLNFIDPATNAADYTIDNTPGTLLWESLTWDESSDDTRDQQVIQVPPGATGATIENFPGDGSTQSFSLTAAPASIVSAIVTGSTAASVTGTFTATNANPGDTVTIAGSVYMFVASLNNSSFGEVLIGATSQASTQNLVDAINANPAQSRITFSAPTWANLSVYSAQPTGSPARTFIVYARALGNLGNGIAVSESTAGFSWSSGTTSGGADLLPSGTYQINVDVGSTAVTVTPAMPTGTSAVVTYYPSLTTIITVGSGGTARNSTLDPPLSQQAALQEAQAVLSTYCTPPATLDYQSDRPGLYVCDYALVAFTYPVTSPALANGHWIVQEVQASLIPGKDTLQAPYNHFRYNYQLINSLGVPPFTQFIDALAAVGDSAPQVMQPVTPDVVPTSTRIAQLNLFDLTVGNDIALHTIITTPYTTTSPISHSEDQGVRILAELKEPLLADLTVNINKATLCTSPPSSNSWTITIPQSTPVKTVLYTTITGNFCDGDIMYSDVVASDGQKNNNGIATLTLEWEP